MPISPRARLNAANHAIVTALDAAPVSEFLINGWQHGSLTRIGCIVEIRVSRDSCGILERGVFFGTDFALSTDDAVTERPNERDRTADGEENE